MKSFSVLLKVFFIITFNWIAINSTTAIPSINTIITDNDVNGVYLTSFKCNNIKYDYKVAIQHSSGKLIAQIDERLKSRSGKSERFYLYGKEIERIFKGNSIILLPMKGRLHEGRGGLSLDFHENELRITYNGQCQQLTLVKDPKLSIELVEKLRYEEDLLKSETLSYANAKDSYHKYLAIWKWTNVVKQRGPDILEIRPDKKISDDRFYPLYFDFVFKPVFGKSYDEMTISELSDIHKEIELILYDNPSYWRMEQWQKTAISHGFIPKYRWEKVKEYVVYGRKTYPEFNKDLKRLKDFTIDINEEKEVLIEKIDFLFEARDKVEEQYGRLWNIDKKAIERLSKKTIQDFHVQIYNAKKIPPDENIKDRFDYDINRIKEEVSSYEYFRQAVSVDEHSDHGEIVDYLELRERKYTPQQFPQSLQLGKNIKFKNEFVSRIYYGHFNWVDLNRRYNNIEVSKMGELYVLVNHVKCGANQLHPTTLYETSIKQVTTDAFGGNRREEDWGKGDTLYIDDEIVDLYKGLPDFYNLSHIYNSEKLEKYDYYGYTLKDDLINLIETHGCKSLELRQFFNNYLNFNSGQSSMQYQFHDWLSQKSDDRFFPPSYYSDLEQKAMHANKRNFIEFNKFYVTDSYSLSSSRMEKAKDATKKLIALAQSKGIKESDITLAMFEGRLNPFFEDLKLAWEGLCTEISSDDVDVATYFILRDRENLSKEEFFKDPLNIKRILRIKRNEIWMERFGRISDLPEINTIVYGKEKKVNAMDLIFYFYQFNQVSLVWEHWYMPPKVQSHFRKIKPKNYKEAVESFK